MTSYHPTSDLLCQSVLTYLTGTHLFNIVKPKLFIEGSTILVFILVLMFILFHSRQKAVILDLKLSLSSFCVILVK